MTGNENEKMVHRREKFPVWLKNCKNFPLNRFAAYSIMTQIGEEASATHNVNASIPI